MRKYIFAVLIPVVALTMLSSATAAEHQLLPERFPYTVTVFAEQSSASGIILAVIVLVLLVVVVIYANVKEKESIQAQEWPQHDADAAADIARSNEEREKREKAEQAIRDEAERLRIEAEQLAIQKQKELREAAWISIQATLQDVPRGMIDQIWAQIRPKLNEEASKLRERLKGRASVESANRLYTQRTKDLIVADESEPMKPVWNKLRGDIRSLMSRREREIVRLCAEARKLWEENNDTFWEEARERLGKRWIPLWKSRSPEEHVRCYMIEIFDAWWENFHKKFLQSMHDVVEAEIAVRVERERRRRG